MAFLIATAPGERERERERERTQCQPAFYTLVSYHTPRHKPYLVFTKSLSPAHSVGKAYDDVNTGKYVSMVAILEIVYTSQGI